MLEALIAHYKSPMPLATTHSGLLVQHKELEQNRRKLSEALQSVLRCIALVEERVRKQKGVTMENAMKIIKGMDKEQLDDLVKAVVETAVPLVVQSLLSGKVPEIKA